MEDIRNALRHWGRTPLITALAMASLALAIGSTLALFALVDALLFKTLPIRQPEQLTRIVGQSPRPGETQDIGVTTRVWEHIRDGQTMFASMLAVGTDRVNIARGGEARYVGCAYVSSTYFETLGVRVLAGRPLQAADDRPGSASVAVISHSLWQRDFGGEPVIGEAIHLDGHRFTIVGIAPKGFLGLEVGRADDVIVPLAAQDIIRGPNSHLRRAESSWLQIYGRLGNASEFESARAALAAWFPTLREATADGRAPSRHLPFAFDLAHASRGRSFLRSVYGNALQILLVAVSLLLAIAAMNLAILSTARYADRRLEIGVRLSLGASRGRILRLLLVDSLLQATIGGSIGLWLGYWTAGFATRFLTINRFAAIDTTLGVELDSRLLTVAIVTTLVSAVLAVILPARRAMQLTPLDSMREQIRGQHSAGAMRHMRVLTSAQVALAVALLISASLLVRSFVQLTTRPMGVDADRIVVAIVTDPFQGKHQAEVFQRIERTRGALATVPGVTSVSAGLVTPLSGLMAATQMQIPGSQALPMSGAGPFNYILPGYFDTLGTPLLMGRDFNLGDVAASPGGSRSVAIVNQAFAQRHYGGFNPIGRTILLGERETQIVGVVANSRTMSMSEDRDVAMAYGPLAQRATNPNANLRWVIRSDSPRTIQGGIMSALRAIDPRIGVEFRSMRDEAISTVNRERLLAWLGGFFASVGLLIAVVGIYGTFTYAIVRRRVEIGVRFALGAQTAQVIRQLLKEAALTVFAGVTIGIIAAQMAARWMQSLLHGLSARDIETTIVASVMVIVAAMVATYLPARSAAMVPPMSVLKE